MKKYRIACLVALLLAAIAVGCGQKDLDTVLKGHKAMKLYQEGVWEPRYENASASGSGSKNETLQIVLSIDVKEEMSETDRMEVLDYYYVKTKDLYITDGDSIDCSCYAVFYQGDTNEELFRVKLRNGVEEELTDDDNSIFPLPGMRTEVMGEWP
ncbi:hypothetical protein AALC25_14690 [Lachnospiraceae bacterium 29-84]